MIDIKSTDRICVAGLPGTGKTYLMRYFCTLLEPDLIIVDPLSQYDMFPDECRYVPRRETPNELEEICKQLMARANCTLVIEEAEQYLSQQRAMLPATSQLIRMGRNWGIGIYATTRRIQDINKRFFDLAQHCFFFRCGLKSRDYIADMLGAEFVYPYPSPKYNSTGYCVTTLPPYHFLHFNLEDETAEIGVLKLGAREHIAAAGTKSEAPSPKEVGKEEKPEQVQEQEVKEGKEEKVDKARQQAGSKNATQARTR